MSGREKVREEKGRMEVLQERVEEFIPPFLPFITVTNWICSFLMQYLLVHLVISSTLSASFSGEREAGAVCTENENNQQLLGEIQKCTRFF